MIIATVTLESGLSEQEAYRVVDERRGKLLKYCLKWLLRHYRSGHVPACESEADYRAAHRTGALSSFL